MLCSLSFFIPQLLILITLSSSPFAISNTSSSMDPVELETLMKIMETLSSDLDWRSSYPNPCNPSSSLPGIECKNLHITRLDFGTPPNPICKNSATFPPEIFHLPHLQSVFISHCFTHNPTTISLTVKNNTLSLSPLQQLSLRSNPALVGQIPPLISSLKSLQVLTLSQNKLTGKIPVEILALTSLLHLDLSYNNLTGRIPTEFSRLRNLIGLDFSYNKLMGPIPSSLGNLTDLQKLDLSSNSLTGRIPDTIGNLQSLSFLALSNNRLSGDFPPGISDLRSLQYFLMDDNPTMKFVSLPEELGQLKKLQEVRLSNSGYSGVIPIVYSELANLSSLSLQENRLSGRIPAGFVNLSHIYHMNLSGNLLEGVVPFDSGFLRRLGRNLDLSGNPGLLCFGESSNKGIDVCGGVSEGVSSNELCCSLLFMYVTVLCSVMLLG